MKNDENSSTQREFIVKVAKQPEHCDGLFLGGYGRIFNNKAEKAEVHKKHFCSVYEEKLSYVVIYYYDANVLVSFPKWQSW